MNLVNKLLAVAFLHITLVAGQLNKGDECRLKDSRSGICKTLIECPEEIDNLRNGIFPQQCGFEGTRAIVCCAQAQSTTPNKPAEPPVTQSTTTFRQGDECRLKDSRSGICKTLIECPEEIANLRNGIFPQQCGFEGTQAIVCCAQAQSTTPNKPAEPLVTQSATPKPTTLPNVTSRSSGVVSNQKCIEYTEYIWSKEINPTLLTGGTRTGRKEFPHMVQFGYDASSGLLWTCGGSLISDQFVLTAAHCLSDRSLGDVKYARMGIVDLDDDDHMQLYNVVDRIPYSKYEAPALYHDIGLVKLEKLVELNNWVRPACLYTNPSSPLSNVIATGWGNIAFAGEASRILLKVILELYDQPKCNETYRKLANSSRLVEGIKDEIMICAGHSKELKDTCQGDSGGPIQVYIDGDEPLSFMFHIVGVTSFGQACGIAVNVPAVYTRVSFYVKWIEDIVWPQ